MTPSSSIFRNEINTLGDFRGRVKFARDFAGQKNDYNDAEAIAEAALRPNLRMV